MQIAIGGLLFGEEESVNVAETLDDKARDPFVSLLPSKKEGLPSQETRVSRAPENPPGFSVQGLIWGTNKPQAIIDNKVYNVGEEVQGAKIIEISKDGAKVLYQGAIFLIAPQTIKGSSKNQ